jgi:hypothetical protein
MPQQATRFDSPRLNHRYAGRRSEICSAGKDGDGLDVRGVGEKVEEVEFGDAIAGRDEDL